MGGIRTGLDALEFVLAGANAVSVGTAVFGDPSAPIRVLDELARALVERGFTRFEDAISAAHRPPDEIVPEGPDPVGDELVDVDDEGIVLMVRARAPIAVALDAPDVETAARWAMAVTPHVSVVKVGLELFCRTGPSVVETVRGGSGVDLFLDLKLHDIPNTVGAAAKAVARLKPRYLTVHASGGADMVRAAVESAPEVTIAAVTVLTSLSAEGLDAIGLSGPPLDAVRRLAALAVGAGAGALVCSPMEVVRGACRGRTRCRPHHPWRAPGRR